LPEIFELYYIGRRKKRFWWRRYYNGPLGLMTCQTKFSARARLVVHNNIIYLLYAVYTHCGRPEYSACPTELIFDLLALLGSSTINNLFGHTHTRTHTHVRATWRINIIRLNRLIIIIYFFQSIITFLFHTI